MSKKIFISHAVKDKPIVDAFVDLLQTGANIPYDEIFCSSLEGLGIPPGANFIDHIKDEIQSPDMVIAVISEHYLLSQFCMCELGATWAMSHNMFPLIVPPLNFSDVSGILKSTHMVRLGDESGLGQFATEIDSAFSKIKVNIARWNVKQKTFLKKLPRLLEEVGSPEIVSLSEHETLKNELAETRALAEELEENNSALEEKVDLLKACKDSSEVSAVERQFTNDEEKLDALIDSAKSRLEDFNSAFSYVAYRQYAFGEEAYIDYYKAPESLDAANSGVEHEFLLQDEAGFSLNEAHPRVKKVKKALDAIVQFIEHEASAKLHESYKEEYEIPLSIGNREFWEFALDPRLKHVYA